MADPKQHYDVALSFMMADMGLARDLYHRLSGNLSVFFFERKQEELTGRDGLEGFRAPFRDALVSVVLYRPPYGEANWTGVEKTAIGEACQKRGYRNLFVVMTDPTAKLPDWIPATHIYFSVSMFPVEELVGAIKTKVLELGGKLEPMTTAKRVEHHKEAEKYQAEWKRLRKTSDGKDAMAREIATLFKEIERQGVEAVRAGTHIRVGFDAGRCVMTNDKQSLIARWDSARLPGIEEDRLKIEYFRWNFALPAERSLQYYEEPQVERPESYDLELTMARNLVWKDKAGESFTSAQLAEAISFRFFDFVEAIISGQNQKGPKLTWL